MSALVSTIEIDCPPDKVFAVATDPHRYADWQRDVVGVRMTGVSTFVTTRRFAGAKRAMTQEVTRNEPPCSFAVRGVDGPVRAHASIEVEPLDEGTRSRVTFTLDFDGHGVGTALIPLVRRQAARGAPVSYANLKRLLEQSP
ncbi:MAG: SRPBCC family protein [Hamadaea sp.]|uniref:SRPBCC family protein n=1 Tax=Hamadaea sp. TaxID=2024425 RepID=UPI0017B3EF9D|nr:SRPBCC family protein [Hamadaea sp.]NUT18637.1 SRPBCC family protein [Hamadaea sp.]